MTEIGFDRNTGLVVVRIPRGWAPIDFACQPPDRWWHFIRRLWHWHWCRTVRVLDNPDVVTHVENKGMEIHVHASVRPSDS